MGETIPQDLMTRWQDAGHLEALTFQIRDETFAFEAGVVREILDLLPETQVPGASPLVGAVINFRGKVIPLADLRLAFDIEAADASADQRIIVIELELDGEATLVGVRADKVNEVAGLAFDQIEPPPSIGMRYRPEYIRCLINRPGGLVLLPDLDRIFSPQQPAAAAGARP